MSYEAIGDHLTEMYSLEVSPAKISQITDRLILVSTETKSPFRNSLPNYILGCQQGSVITIFKYSEALRRIIYTTNIVERFVSAKPKTYLSSYCKTGMIL
ncbi:hypothetical protein TUM19329_07310 [Legionella antarctica]|uniref:Uncharacterized protein n=1 Tax=Legionella antarctica TaxID=2708020 RepID=A0A6F8T2I6_9GAMM|nr:hypothetical protein TUM19329_07310 [Legionella antarctica]